MASTSKKCVISNIAEILDAINLALVQQKKRELKKRDWHTVLSSQTENDIKPFWINEFFRKNRVDAINAEKVKVAMEAHAKSLGVDIQIILHCAAD